MSRTDFCVLTLIALWLGAGTARAQSPYVETLPDTPPRNVAFHVGPIQFWPGLRIRDVGVDTNVFDESENPKSDWLVNLQPDLTIWGQAGYFRVSARTGADLLYFAKYESERSVSTDARVRLDGHFGLIRPWVGVATVGSATRPNAEIDLRARRREHEYSGGVAFDATPTASLFVAVTRQSTAYQEDEVFRAVRLSTVLDRDTETYGVGARIKLTPFTTMTARYEQDQDTFVNNPQRDSEGRSGSVELAFSPEAIISGRVRVGFRDLEFAGDNTEGYRGLVASGGVISRFYMSRLEVQVSRRLQYSVESEHTYFVDSGAEVDFIQRIRGPIDAQVRGAISQLRYDSAVDGARFTDVVRSFMAGVGYNFDDRSRVAVHFEYAQRDSESIVREYDRRRYFASYTQSFQ